MRYVVVEIAYLAGGYFHSVGMAAWLSTEPL